MDQAKRIERKVFLAWALGSTSAALLGCSDEAGDPSGSGGTTPGGSGGNPFTNAGSGGTAAGTGGAGGSFQSAGTAGTAPAGGGGTSSAGNGGVGGSGGAPPAPNCSTQLRVLITADHGHALEVSLADVMAGVTKAYDTKGKSDHSHWIVLTPADFTKLQAGMSVRKLSCNEEHEHEFIINCVGVDKPETTSGVANFCDAEHLCGEAAGKPCADPM